MLTDYEKQWLEDRDAIQFATGNFLHEPYLKNECDDYRDAAEFEARVAEKLSALINYPQPPDFEPGCISCPAFKNDDGNACVACVIKEARLAVEEEMESSK